MSEVWTYKMKRDNVNLYFRGDIHLGSKQADIDAWLKTNDMIANDPIAFDFGMGDYLDSIVAKDKRYDPFNRDSRFESVDDAFTFFEGHYSSVKDKSGGLLVGNHEWTLIQYSEMNEVRKICRRLKIPYLSYSALMRLEFPNGKELSDFIAHGAGGGRKIGGKANRLDEVKGKFPGIDFAVYGHTHEMFTRPVPILLMNGNDIDSHITETMGIDTIKKENRNSNEEIMKRIRECEKLIVTDNSSGRYDTYVSMAENMQKPIIFTGNVTEKDNYIDINTLENILKQ